MGSDRRNGGIRRVTRLTDLTDLVTPMAIRVAASLRLADHIGAGTASVATLAERTGVHSATLAMLVRHLVAVGVFAGGDGELRLTPLGRQLRVAQPFLDIEDSVGRGELSLLRLLDSVRSGEPAYPLVFGTTFWDDLAARPAMKASFDEMTDRHLADELDPLVSKYDWWTVDHLIDIGAGNGALLAKLLAFFPHLQGTIVELPGSVPNAKATLAAAGLAERCAVVAGDFFASLTHLPAGTLMLSSVLHDWDDAAASLILRRCAEALAGFDPPRRLVIIDSFHEDGDVDTHMDLRMLAMFGGRQRSLEDLARLAAGAGLRAGRQLRLRRKWLIELQPADH